MNINLKLKKEIFNDTYLPYLMDYSRRFEHYFGGGGSGKSHFVAQKLTIKALKSRRKILVVRKVMKSQKDSCFQLVIDVLFQFQIHKYCEINKSDFTIKLPNGSVFLFKGMDDPEKIKSIVGITDIWYEEATEGTWEEYSQLDIRLRSNAPDLQFISTYNPVSKANYVYQKFHKPGTELDERRLIVQTTYKDNKFLPQSYIDSLEAMKRTNPAFYKIYTLGEFATLDKLVFPYFTTEDFNHEDIKGILLVGLDFGFVNDTTALVASVMDKTNKKIYIFDCAGDTNLTNDKIANLIKYKGFAKSVIIADCVEQKSIKEIKNYGINKIKPCSKGADSVLHGIQQLQQYELIVHPKCTEIITEFENYSWQKDKSTGEYINKPIDNFNHYIDALRYSLQCAKAKIKIPNVKM